MKGGYEMKYRKVIFISFLFLLLSFMCLFVFAQGVGYIQIKCEHGATVFLDKNYVGNTSSELGGLILQDVPVGSHVIKIVKEGFEPQSVKIDLKVNEIYVYEVKEFIPQLDVKQEGETDTDTIKQRVGSLLIETIPIDCIIEIPKLNINKEHYGNKTKKTWEISNIPIGNYRINFIALGKKIEYELKIEEGIQKHLLVNILKNEVKEILATQPAKEVLPILTWSKIFNRGSKDIAYSLIQTNDGGYAVAGGSKEGYSSDFWVIKLDSKGNKIWDKTYGGRDDDIAYSLIQTTDGGYAIAGKTRSYGVGNADFWVIKLDSKGNKIWDKTFGGRSIDIAYSLIQTTDGGYAVAGETKSYGAGYTDFWVIKLDSKGNKIWNKTFGGSSGGESATTIIQTTDGGYAVAGGTTSYSAGKTDFWVIKLDSEGNKIWDKTFGGSSYESAKTIIQTTDGGYAVAGPGFWILKMDSKGNKLWSKKRFIGKLGDSACSLIQTSDGGYAIAGTIRLSTPRNDALIIKLDNKGNKIWDKTYGGNDWDIPHSIIQASDGGYAIVGQTSPRLSDEIDIWTIKLDK